MAGGATKGADLAVGVGFDRVVFQGRDDGRSDGLFFFGGEIEARGIASFFVRAEAAFGGPIFQVEDVRSFSG